MSPILFFTYYLLVSFLVGLCCIGRRPGFFMAFILSLVITPFLALLILYITKTQEQRQKSLL